MALAAVSLLAAGSGGSPVQAASAAETYPAKLKVLRAGVEDGRLDVLADITKRADGDRMQVSFIANGERFKFTAPIEDGQVRFKRRLPASQRGMSTGIMEIKYEGNDRVRPSEARLRAAKGKAVLRRNLLSLHDGLIVARGSLTERARGVVRLILSYERSDGTMGEWQGRARVRDNGGWSLEEDLPAEARMGGYLSIQFTGYGPRRIRGEQIAKQLADGQSFASEAPTGPESVSATRPSPDATASRPTPAADPGAKATTRPVGSPPLSDAEAAARVDRNGFEPRGNEWPISTRVGYWGGTQHKTTNYPMNNTVPTPVEIAAFNAHPENAWAIKR
ncbi:MAG: hypothetical protein M3401_12905, partial [Actinomycetota bacterium]|nr:hypothetical protein [Actinomycetota bacterium]